MAKAALGDSAELSRSHYDVMSDRAVLTVAVGFGALAFVLEIGLLLRVLGRPQQVGVAQLRQGLGEPCEPAAHPSSSRKQMPTASTRRSICSTSMASAFAVS